MPLLLLVPIISFIGCRKDTPTKPVAKEAAQVTQPTVVKTVSVSGFDPDGEPKIRVMGDGSLSLMFEFMPPSWGESDEKSFENFDKQLEQALGVLVLWEDREFFRIPSPKADTAEKARVFLESYRKSKRK